MFLAFDRSDAADRRAEDRPRRVAHARRRRGAPPGAHPRALGQPNPNVCRVHDLAPSLWGPILVMEHITGQTLHTHIRRKKAQGGYTADEFRQIASEVCPGLAAIHAQGLVHGDLKPGNVMVTSTDGRRKAIDPRLRLRARSARALSARRPGAPPDGGTPNYMSPGAPPLRRRQRRRRSSTRSASRSGRCGPAASPSPATSRARRRCASRSCSTCPPGSSIDEIKQIFRCLNEDPQMRPQARHLRFFNPAQLTTSPVQVPRERLDPGPAARPRAQTRPSRRARRRSSSTFATNAPEFVGELLPLDKPLITHRPPRRSRTSSSPRPPSAARTPSCSWQAGSWLIEDLGSTNGSYADHNYERKTRSRLMHGGEVAARRAAASSS